MLVFELFCGVYIEDITQVVTSAADQFLCFSFIDSSILLLLLPQDQISKL